MSAAGIHAGAMPACFDTRQQWDEWAFLHSFVRGANDARIHAATAARVEANARLVELNRRMEIIGEGASPADARALRQAREDAATAKAHEFQVRAAVGQRIAKRSDICGDCTHRRQTQMIRERRCSNSLAILPGHPRHRWLPEQQLPPGMKP